MLEATLIRLMWRPVGCKLGEAEKVANTAVAGR